MTTTPLLLLLNERFILPRFGTAQGGSREADRIDEAHPVIIAGFSSFGSTLGRFLRANSIKATILDNNSDQVDLLRKMGFQVFYGDATRLDILHAAGADSARILIIAIDEPATAFSLTETVKKHFPHLTLVTRARNDLDACALIDQGVQHLYRDCHHSAIRAGVEVLVHLGFLLVWRRRIEAACDPLVARPALRVGLTPLDDFGDHSHRRSGGAGLGDDGRGGGENLT